MQNDGVVFKHKERVAENCWKATSSLSVNLFFGAWVLKEITTYFREVLQFRRWIKVQSTVRGPRS